MVECDILKHVTLVPLTRSDMINFLKEQQETIASSPFESGETF